MASTAQEALPLAVKGKVVTKSSSPEEPEWKSLTQLHRNTTGRSLQARFTYEHKLSLSLSLSHTHTHTHTHTCAHTHTHMHKDSHANNTCTHYRTSCAIHM